MNPSLTIRIILFLAITLTALTAGFLMPTQWLAPAFHYSGYYFMLPVFLLWSALLIDISRTDFPTRAKKHAPALLLAAFLMVLIVNIAPPRFKILADETNLISVSMAMNHNKTTSTLLEGLAVEYYAFDYAEDVGPRPLVFPFVVSIVHAVLGYSPYNGMVVNFLAGIGILFLIYLAASHLFSRFFGFVAMVLTASFPIFIFWVTSSGFETINLFFLVAALAGLLLFLKNRNVKYAEFFLVSLVLLANCRYESVIFVLPLLLLAPVFLNRQAIMQYRLHMLLLPLFFLPFAWQRRINFLNSTVRGDMGLIVPENPFGWAYFKLNISDNIFWSEAHNRTDACLKPRRPIIYGKAT